MKIKYAPLDNISLSKLTVTLSILGLTALLCLLFEDSAAKKWRTGKLSTVNLIDTSCLSKSLQHLHRTTGTLPKHSDALLKEWDGYIDMHRVCSQQIRSNWTRVLADPYTASSSNSSCKYLVHVERGEGLGNRILSLVSALVYALLTNRALFLDSRRQLTKVLCEPFHGSSWLLPPDFPYGRIDGAPDIGKAIQREFNQIPVVHLKLAHIESPTDRLFFCDEYQQHLSQVPVLAWSSNQYFVTNFFKVPSLWRRLLHLFPSELNVFTQIAALAISPANEVWTLITRYYMSYLEHTETLVGIQIRPHSRPNLAEFDPKVHRIVVNCLTGLSLYGLDKVLVASLQAKYYQTLRDEFLRNATNQLVGFYTLSSEGFEKVTLHQARLALAEMWLLSYSKHIVTSEYSTFGYIAHGVGNMRPWLLKIRGRSLNDSDSCYLGQSTEPCTHFPQSFNCSGSLNKEHLDWIESHIAECLDQKGGLQLIAR